MLFLVFKICSSSVSILFSICLSISCSLLRLSDSIFSFFSFSSIIFSGSLVGVTTFSLISLNSDFSVTIFSSDGLGVSFLISVFNSGADLGSSILAFISSFSNSSLSSFSSFFSNI
jgi:hypothetical protein